VRKVLPFVLVGLLGVVAIGAALLSASRTWTTSTAQHPSAASLRSELLTLSDVPSGWAVQLGPSVGTRPWLFGVVSASCAVARGTAGLSGEITDPAFAYVQFEGPAYRRFQFLGEDLARSSLTTVHQAQLALVRVDDAVERCGGGPEYPAPGPPTLYTSEGVPLSGPGAGETLNVRVPGARTVGAPAPSLGVPGEVGSYLWRQPGQTALAYDYLRDGMYVAFTYTADNGTPFDSGIYAVITRALERL
jgi:hypothetical protein